MKKRFVVGVAGLMAVLIAALVFPLVTAAAGGPPEGRGMRSDNWQGSGSVTSGVLTAEQQAALVDFWTDEHKALATYQAVMAQFGEVQPFASIANAERSHIAALENVFARYGVAVPEIPTFDAPSFDTLDEACAAAAQAEIDNAALYEDLTAVFTQPDILRVMDNLSRASLNQHLSAFEQCAEGTYEPGIIGEGAGYRAGTAIQPQSQGGQGSRGRGRSQAPRGNAQSAGCLLDQD